MRKLQEILKEKPNNLTVNELRKAIRYYTAEINVRVAEYRAEGYRSKIVEAEVSKLRARAGTKSKHAIGVGVERKTKVELQQQLIGLIRFENKDIFTPEGERRWAEKTQRQYETFKENFKEYGNINEEVYDKFIDAIYTLKNDIKDFGYEDFGRDLVKQFVGASTAGQTKFVDIVSKVVKAGGKNRVQIIDEVQKELRKY